MSTKGFDYFAELYVAGVLARAGWNVYFPHRDEGFDFIITKLIGGKIVMRPVQVKGKYPEPTKTDKATYGYVGKLSQLHEDMVLAIPYFQVLAKENIPVSIAFMPYSQIKRHIRGYRCQPASFKDGQMKIKRTFAKFFNGQGIKLIESENWKDSIVADCA